MIAATEAYRIVIGQMAPLPPRRLPLSECAGLVLAETVVSQVAYPPFDSSAIDGFAVQAGDTASASGATPVTLPIVFAVAAGDATERTLAPGQACRIMTGARIPKGADACIMREDVTDKGDRVVIPEAVLAGEFFRPLGEDLMAGDTVLQPGDVLTPPRLALLAAVGRPDALVHPRPRVAILSTGDELVEPGRPLEPGQIYNSNAVAMAAWITEAGGEAVRLPIVPDDREETRRLIAEAAGCDAVVSSGGVSMGDHDHVGHVLHEMGHVHFTRVAQQPGKPFTFATVSGKPVFALPGNPAATMVGLEVYLRPALRRMMGHRHLQRAAVQAALSEPIKQKDRLQFLRGRLEEREDGMHVALTGPQGSGLITAMAWANALLVIPAGDGRLGVGERVTALVLEPEWLLNSHIGYDEAVWQIAPGIV
jgi:molybdopterin molybdotransferase